MLFISLIPDRGKQVSVGQKHLRKFSSCGTKLRGLFVTSGSEMDPHPENKINYPHCKIGKGKSDNELSLSIWPGGLVKQA